MNQKNRLLILLLVVLGAIYAIWFTDWFQPKSISIFHTSRGLRGRNQPAGAAPALIFGLGRSVKLTEIKVVPLAAFQTNPAVLPVWHIVSDSNSIPMKSFFYGQFIRGLKPAVPGSRAKPLEKSTPYRLIVVAGKIHGEHDFEVQ